MRATLISVIFIFSAQSILYVNSSVLDLSLLSSGYELDDYLANHSNSDNPWIVSTFQNAADFGEQPFVPPINLDYTTQDTSSNHLGNVNHINNQFARTFISNNNVDKVLNSLLNSDAILSQSNPVFDISQHDIEKCADHNANAFSNQKPYNGYKKQTITSVQRPINLDGSPHSVFVPIYPWHIPIAKPTTIKEITGSIIKKIPYYSHNIVLPYRRSDKGIGLHKKTPFVLNFPTLKSLIFHRAN